MSLSQVLGQERPLRRLRPYLKDRTSPQALLFHGSEGVGKALAALQYAKTLNCLGSGASVPFGSGERPPSGDRGPLAADCCDLCPPCAAADKGVSPEIRRVNPAYQAALRNDEEAKQRSIRVDTVRHLIKDLEMRSMSGAWKAAILEDAHTLEPASSNAMLKALEEPPPKTVWILVTHRPQELLPTIRSRCQAVPFSPLPEEALLELLQARGAPEADARAAAALAEGSVGRALRVLEEAVPDPASWLDDPLAPVRMAEALPRELHLSRPSVASQIVRMLWHIRSQGPGYASPAARSALRELDGLRRALDSNADPRLVLELAALRLQRMHTTSPRSLPG